MLSFFHRLQTIVRRYRENRVVHVADAPKTSREGRIEPYSETWTFLSHWLEADLAKSRESNDSSKRDALQTAELRGRIKLLKELIDMPVKKERPRIPVDGY
jgi:hypothetical protein